MRNENLLLNNLKEINISSNASYNFDEMYNNNDILTYSESKSESTFYLNKNINNDYLIDNKSQSLKNIILSQEGEKSNDNNIINKKNDNGIELSELKISLSNLSSDKENKENIICNNKTSMKKPKSSINDKNYFIDISNDISNNKETDNENIKLKSNQNEEQSSVCNYSKSSYLLNNNDNNKIKDYNNKILYTSPSKRKEYQIEKGENINISLAKNENDNYNKDKSSFNNHHNYNDINLSINQAYNFTINSIIDYRSNTNYNFTGDNFNSTKNKENSRIIKNKIKLINNKNIFKVDSKKFFYKPKRKIIKDMIKINKDEDVKRHNKIKNNLTVINIITNPKLMTDKKNVVWNSYISGIPNSEWFKKNLQIDIEISKKFIKIININNINDKNQINLEKNLEIDFLNQNKFSKTFTQFKNNINSKTKEKNKLFLKKKKLFYLNKNKNINKEKYNTINISENNTLNNNKTIKFNTMIFTQDLMKKIKTEQKETKNKLIKNINNKFFIKIIINKIIIEKC